MYSKYKSVYFYAKKSKEYNVSEEEYFPLKTIEIV